jgi:hypothetical protein
VPPLVEGTLSLRSTKTRGWEDWLIASFLADAIAALFTVVTTSVFSLHCHQYAYQAG